MGRTTFLKLHFAYVLISFLFNLFGSGIARFATRRLERYNVDPAKVTISGFSSGGAQAMQFHFIHSSKVSGVGIFSGVPYLYGYGRQREDFYVTEPDQFNVTFALEMAKQYEVQRLVDPLKNMAKSSVYIYHGTRDKTVFHGSGKAIQKIYSKFNCTMLAHLDEMPADHGMPSDNSGGPCGTLNLLHYLVNKCNYNGVYEMFNHLYGGELEKPEGTVGTVPLKGEFFEFDQSEFLERKSSMDNIGYAYIPSKCFPNGNYTCKFAIALHGCVQSRQTYGDKFARTTGYLEMAELNDIVVIFPQTKMSFLNPRNPSGCWDWMGFTSAKYFATNKGLQVIAIERMMNRVLGVI